MERKNTDRIIDIVEDHALIEHYVTALVVSLRTRQPLPVVPALNDGAMSDMLSFVAESLKTES